jgi:hypothetical protein
VLAVLVETMHAAHRDPALLRRIQDLASELPAPGQDTPEALADFTKAESARWTEAIQKGNIKAQ